MYKRDILTGFVHLRDIWRAFVTYLKGSRNIDEAGRVAETLQVKGDPQKKSLYRKLIVFIASVGCGEWLCGKTELNHGEWEYHDFGYNSSSKGIAF